MSPRWFFVIGVWNCPPASPLTPDGHLASESPFVFDESLAVHQVIALVEADIATEDKEEALASTWLGLGYHDHDHPADFGGIVLDTSRPGPPTTQMLLR